MDNRNEYRIMIVDDEKIVRQAVAEHIDWARYGIRVAMSAANAMEALDFLEKEDVDVMLVDVRMPVMDGLELIRRVSERPRHHRPQFIILTGYSEFEYARKAMHYGVRDYLLKPVEEAELVDAVRRCQQRARRDQFQADMKGIPEETDTSAAYSGTVRDIIRIVEEELANDSLSLKWISSERLFLNENYMSRLFQKETGMKFSAFLMQKRMTRAMKLMADPQDYQIQNVAQMCGFGDNSQYFSSSFRKYTGYTPSEYRRYIRNTEK